MDSILTIWILTESKFLENDRRFFSHSYKFFSKMLPTIFFKLQWKHKLIVLYLYIEGEKKLWWNFWMPAQKVKISIYKKNYFSCQRQPMHPKPTPLQWRIAGIALNNCHQTFSKKIFEIKKWHFWKNGQKAISLISNIHTQTPQNCTEHLATAM